MMKSNKNNEEMLLFTVVEKCYFSLQLKINRRNK